MADGVTRRRVLAAGAAVGGLAALGPRPGLGYPGDAGTAGGVPLIPRRVLFAPADRELPRLSPDGRHVLWLARSGGARNLWLAPVDDPAAARPLTSLGGRGVTRLTPPAWSADGRAIIFGSDGDGDENTRLSAVWPADGRIVALTPETGVRAGLVGVSPRQPGHVLVSHNGRDRRFFDGWRVDLSTGAAEPVFENDGFVNFWADRDLRVRLAMRRRADAGVEYVAIGPDGARTPTGGADFEDMETTTPLLFADDGRTLYWIDSRGRDKAALTARDADGTVRVLGQDPAADVSGAVFDPVTLAPLGWRFNPGRPRWTALDPRFADDLAYLGTVEQGDIDFAGWSADGTRALVWFNDDDGPARFRLYDRTMRRAPYLFASHDGLDGLPLVPMETVTIRSRDGLDLVSHLSRPRGAAGPVPLVLVVHGGPHSRDAWGLSPTHQWLANRGYAVLSVNFRGSTGFGKRFLTASYGEWGARMQDDLLDAVDWAVREGVADRARVAVMGASYGGYATLAALTMTPGVFACGVASAAMANLETFLDTLPPYWRPNAAIWHRRIGGDPATAEGRAFLAARSPLTHVGRMTAPLLLGHGANDPRVKPAESERVVAAAQARGLPVVYAVFPDEGHGFARPANQVAWRALTEAFLAKHLGGRMEPVGRDLAGSSIEIRAGRELVPGIAG